MINNHSRPIPSDTWRRAILSERKQGVHQYLIQGLKHYTGPRNHTLVLGDASLIQANYLLTEGGFGLVTDVDSSPTLLDEEVVAPENRKKLKKCLVTFSDFDYPKQEYDFIYGKSIAFTPKKNVGEVLLKIANSLKSHGVFVSVWAMEGDSFRKEFYTKEELQALYIDNGFNILTLEEESKTTKGLVTPGKVHILMIIANKNQLSPSPEPQ